MRKQPVDLAMESLSKFKTQIFNATHRAHQLGVPFAMSVELKGDDVVEIAPCNWEKLDKLVHEKFDHEMVASWEKHKKIAARYRRSGQTAPLLIIQVSGCIGITIVHSTADKLRIGDIR